MIAASLDDFSKKCDSAAQEQKEKDKAASLAKAEEKLQAQSDASSPKQ